MKVVLINSAEAEEDFLREVIGRRNVLLNDTGRRQVLRLKNRLVDKKFDACFCSPLIRAFETAIVLFGDKCEIIKDELLIEREMGELEGRSVSEYNEYQFCDYKLNRNDYGIETIHDLVDRCSKFLDSVKEKYDGTVAIVTHKEVYRILRHLLLNHDINKKLLDGPIQNCLMEEFDIKK